MIISLSHALESIDSLSVQSLYSCTRRSVSYGENYSDGTQRSVSYGEDTVRLLYMVHVLYGYCLLYASDLSRRSMHGKMAGLVTVWHGSGPSHSPIHSPSHSLSHCLRNDGLSPRITFGAALTGAYRPAEIRPRRRSSAHLPSWACHPMLALLFGIMGGWEHNRHNRYNAA